jgi:hypothetical protein
MCVLAPSSRGFTYVIYMCVRLQQLPLQIYLGRMALW